MSGTTANRGYPYPSETDFADVQDAFRLASAIDADIRTEQAPFRAFMGRPSFIGRSTANGSVFISGSDTLQMGAIEWDNTGGVNAGNSSWSQPLNQPPAWWLFGLNILMTNSGAATVLDLVEAQISVQTIDQVTGVASVTSFWQRNDEANVGGEWLVVTGMAPIYHGSVSGGIQINGGTSKGIGAGSRLWGMYLGPVS